MSFTISSSSEIESNFPKEGIWKVVNPYHADVFKINGENLEREGTQPELVSGKKSKWLNKFNGPYVFYGPFSSFDEANKSIDDQPIKNQTQQTQQNPGDKFISDIIANGWKVFKAESPYDLALYRKYLPKQAQIATDAGAFIITINRSGDKQKVTGVIYRDPSKRSDILEKALGVGSPQSFIPPSTQSDGTKYPFVVYAQDYTQTGTTIDPDTLEVRPRRADETEPKKRDWIEAINREKLGLPDDPVQPPPKQVVPEGVPIQEKSFFAKYWPIGVGVAILAYVAATQEKD